MVCLASDHYEEESGNMSGNVPRAKYSAGQDALENFQTLASYAATGARKAKRRVHENGHAVTVIKDGRVIKVMPNGREETISNVAKIDSFKPLTVSA